MLVTGEVSAATAKDEGVLLLREYKLYLAGQITGLTFDGAQSWHAQVRALLPACIKCYSPLRGKDFLRTVGELAPGPYPEHALATGRGVMGRDHNDVRTADAVLMNLLGMGRVSIGCMIEAGLCYAYRVPLIVLMEADGSNPHEHLMFNEIAIYRAPVVETGCVLVQQLLLPERLI